MVAKSHGVKAELVDRFGNLLATIKGVEQRSLELIAGIEPEVVRMLTAEFFDLGQDASVPAEASFGLVHAIGPGLSELV